MSSPQVFHGFGAAFIVGLRFMMKNQKAAVLFLFLFPQHRRFQYPGLFKLVFVSPTVQSGPPGIGVKIYFLLVAVMDGAESVDPAAKRRNLYLMRLRTVCRNAARYGAL